MTTMVFTQELRSYQWTTVRRQPSPWVMMIAEILYSGCTRWSQAVMDAEILVWWAIKIVGRVEVALWLFLRKIEKWYTIQAERNLSKAIFCQAFIIGLVILITELQGGLQDSSVWRGTAQWIFKKTFPNIY